MRIGFALSCLPMLALAGCATKPPLDPLPACPLPTIEILSADDLLLCDQPIKVEDLVARMAETPTGPRLYVLPSRRTQFDDLVLVLHRFYEAGFTKLSLLGPEMRA